jgi:hypothetical protein
MYRKSLVLALSGLGLVAGCSNYYQVRDPESGNIYYTRMVTDHVGGAVSFKDEATGRDVTLQQSEVKHVDSDVYHARTARVDEDLYVRPAAARPYVSPAEHPSDVHLPPPPPSEVHVYDRDISSPDVNVTVPKTANPDVNVTVPRTGSSDVNVTVPKDSDVRIKVDH